MQWFEKHVYVWYMIVYYFIYEFIIQIDWITNVSNTTFNIK